MNVVHLTDSPFFGGPERQILGSANSLPNSIHTTVLCFRDHASAVPFLEQLAAAGVPARMIGHSNPQFLHMIADVRAALRSERADLLVCHGYKANILGWIAARMLAIPVLSVSRGWTGHTGKVRMYERLDRHILRLMDRVVCVSSGQAAKVEKAGVKPKRIRVIRNAINAARFEGLDGSGRRLLGQLFSFPPDEIVIGVGRFSPEKGFDQLVEAASIVTRIRPGTGFVLVGDGPERAVLEARVRALGIEHSVVFSGFRKDIDRLIAAADLLAQSSYTEGMPNVVLEASAASVAVVATDVGGTREVVQDGVTGYLVPAGDARALAGRLLDSLESPSERRVMGAMGHALVSREFSFASQATAYQALFREVLNANSYARIEALGDGVASTQQYRRLTVEHERIEATRRPLMGP